MHQLQLLLSLIQPVPESWYTGEEAKAAKAENEAPPVPAIECTDYQDLVSAWSDTRDQPNGKKGAIYWMESIDVAFSAMLAVVASTKLQGAQIFLRVIGVPGSVKSTLCQAMCANKRYIYRISMITGFHSGQGGQNLWEEMDGKCAVIDEGDMLINAPNVSQTLAQIRDAWTGRATARYRNGVSYDIQGLRIPFIIAGTNTLRKLNRSSAGDRFLDVIIHERNNREIINTTELRLLNRVAEMASEQCSFESDGKPESHTSPEKMFAIQKTVGFINYLRENVTAKIAKVETSKQALNSCIQLAQLVGLMRARPDEKAEEAATEGELATRLTEQFVRFAKCIAVVLNKTSVDKEVLRRLAIVCKDTCKGFTFTVAKQLVDRTSDVTGLSVRMGCTNQHIRNALTILTALGVTKEGPAQTAAGITGSRKGVFRLSPQASLLLKKLNTMLEQTSHAKPD